MAGHGWPLIAHTSEWRLPIDGGADYHWHPLAVAVDAAISVLVFASPILLAWLWLRSPRRLAFRLSTLLLAITALATTLAFAEFERKHSFEVLRWMHPALDCQQSGDRIEALGRVPALAGVACAIFALLTTIRDAARSYHARRFGRSCRRETSKPCQGVTPMVRTASFVDAGMIDSGNDAPLGLTIQTRPFTQGCAALHPGLSNMTPSGSGTTRDPEPEILNSEL